MRPIRRLSVIPVVVAILAGCATTADASSSASQSAPVATLDATISSPSPSAPSTSSATPGEAPSGVPSATPAPSEDLGAFGCDLPIVDVATVRPPANIADVRMGEHPGYDRVVFEFIQGLPEYTLERATPPFLHDATGEPVDVAGSSFLRLSLRGGTRETVDHTSSWDGPRAFHPELSQLVDLVEGGDFEAQSTWYLGLTSEACVRVMRLVGEGGIPRLVIDVEH